jgi:hypothetical protein
MKKTTHRHTHSLNSYTHIQTREKREGRETEEERESSKKGTILFFFVLLPSLLLHLLRLTSRHCHCRYDSFFTPEQLTFHRPIKSFSFSVQISNEFSMFLKFFFFCVTSVLFLLLMSLESIARVSGKNEKEKKRKGHEKERKTKDLMKIDNSENLIPVLFLLLS